MLQLTIKTLIDIDAEIEKTEELLKVQNERKNEVIGIAVKEMDADNVTEITVEGKEFKRDVIMNFSIESHDWTDERFFKFLEDNGAGDIIKTVKSVHAGTRKAFLTEWLEEHGTLPEFIKDSYMDTVKYKQSRKK